MFLESISIGGNMSMILNLLLSGFAVFVSAYLIPGVEVDTFVTAVIVAVVLGVFNAFLKPILILLTLPITILTLGLFTFVINLGLIYLTDAVVSGFTIDGLLSAILFSLVLSLVNGFLGQVGKAE